MSYNTQKHPLFCPYIRIYESPKYFVSKDFFILVEVTSTEAEMLDLAQK